MSDSERMKELVDQLNAASEAYYAKDVEVMSNFEYDKLYDELIDLEETTGIVLANSPTVNVGYEAVDNLPKERHEKPMLSLAKTKSREELRDWLNGKEALLSWKLDGLTIVLTYDDGKLQKAVTRGNGEIGEIITNNAKVFKNLPLSIAYKGELILRGEAVISYSDFEIIAARDEKYKNPRNLCSGSVRQLNNKITAERNVKFFAFSLVKAEDIDFQNKLSEQLAFLKKQGFEVVDSVKVTPDTLLSEIEMYEKKIENYDIPSDGLVLTYEDIAYGQSLGRTAKTPKNAIAFKWKDETALTKLRYIEWSPSRTGLINPVAVFEPVDLEGSTVSRASVHNISVMRGLKLGVGDEISVYKANMIIPQIAFNNTKSDNVKIPLTCPACGGQTKISQMNDVQSLFCTNPDCVAKRIKAFTLFVSRDAMNMDGLSEATLEKFIGKGYIHSFADLFHLDKYKDEIIEMEGFGMKSYTNLIESIEKSRETTLPRLLFALGIANIGVANAKMICREFSYDFEAMQNADVDALSNIDGVGVVIATAFSEYFKDCNNQKNLQELMKEIKLVQEASNETVQNLTGMNFVITGSLSHYSSRKEMTEEIEKRGGKVTGSVTSKTNYLINNDATSNSTKNKTAKELGVKILTEDDFIEQFFT